MKGNVHAVPRAPATDIVVVIVVLLMLKRVAKNDVVEFNSLMQMDSRVLAAGCWLRLLVVISLYFLFASFAMSLSKGTFERRL